MKELTSAFSINIIPFLSFFLLFSTDLFTKPHRSCQANPRLQMYYQTFLFVGAQPDKELDGLMIPGVKLKVYSLSAFVFIYSMKSRFSNLLDVTIISSKSDGGNGLHCSAIPSWPSYILVTDAMVLYTPHNQLSLSQSHVKQKAEN